MHNSTCGIVFLSTSSNTLFHSVSSINRGSKLINEPQSAINGSIILPFAVKSRFHELERGSATDHQLFITKETMSSCTLRRKNYA